MVIRVSFHPREGATHQIEHMKPMLQGMKKNLISCSIEPPNKLVGSDLHIIWSWKSPKIIAGFESGQTNVMSMERGYLPDRTEWCSLAINGFNGQGAFTPATDGGERFKKHFGHLMQPWRTKPDGYVLLIGQVPGDPSLHGLNLNEWLADICKKIHAMGYYVLYRPHPWVREQSKRGTPLFIPRNAIMSSGSLNDDLQGAAFCVCYNSNTSVESVLAGVPTVVFHDGSVSWPVCSHTLDRPIFMPNRMEWASNLAWRQFTKEELADGTAWKHVRYSLPERFWY